MKTTSPAVTTPQATANRVGEALAGNTARYGHGIEISASGYLSAGCEALAALAGHVTRDYGFHGYSFERIWSVTHAVTIAQVRYLDGSRFLIGADQWGNVRTLDNSDLDALAADIAAMHERAVTT